MLQLFWTAFCTIRLNRTFIESVGTVLDHSAPFWTTLAEKDAAFTSSAAVITSTDAFVILNDFSSSVYIVRSTIKLTDGSNLVDFQTLRSDSIRGCARPRVHMYFCFCFLAF